MPGRRRPSGLSRVARTRTLRVASSTTASIAESRPRYGRSAPSRVTCTSPPRRSCATCCCGSEKSTWIGCSDSSDTIGSPAFRYWPRLTWRIPSTPENGARICLRSIVAWISPTRASACLCSALARSYSASATIFCSTRPRALSRLSRARSRWATAAASCARSCRVSSRTSTSPCAHGPSRVEQDRVDDPRQVGAHRHAARRRDRADGAPGSSPSPPGGRRSSSRPREASGTRPPGRSPTGSAGPSRRPARRRHRQPPSASATSAWSSTRHLSLRCGRHPPDAIGDGDVHRARPREAPALGTGSRLCGISVSRSYARSPAKDP